MCDDRVFCSLASVITYQDHGIESTVDALHHPQRPRPGPDKPSSFVEQLDVDILSIAMRVGDQYFRRTCLKGSGNGGIDLLSHQPAKLFIFAPGWQTLY